MVATVSSPHYVLLGLASGEPARLEVVACLVRRRSADDEFIRCTGPVDLATRLGTGRPFSAVLDRLPSRTHDQNEVAVVAGSLGSTSDDGP